MAHRRLLDARASASNAQKLTSKCWQLEHVLRGLLLGLVLFSTVLMHQIKRSHTGLVLLALTADRVGAVYPAINRDRRTPAAAHLNCTAWGSQVVTTLAYASVRPNSPSAGVDNKYDFDKACATFYKSFNSNSPKPKDDPAPVHYFSQPVVTMPLSSGAGQPTDYLVVNVLDFLISYSNTIHIDLANYKRLIKNPTFLDYKRKMAGDGSSTGIRLIFNLVTRHFITFRILNLPNDNKYFSEIVFLLNGESSLDLFEKTSNSSSNANRPLITVLNSPNYDVSSTSSSTATTRTPANRSSWLNYLSSTFYPLKSNSAVVYVERLFKLCAINHVKIDLEQLVTSSIDFINGKRSETGEKRRLLQVSEKLTDTDKLINRCTYSPPLILGDSSLLKKEPKQPAVNSTRAPSEATTSENVWNRNPVQHLSSSFNQIYLFEIENSLTTSETSSEQAEDDMNSNYLRMFINECDINKQYLLIFFSNSSSSSKKIYLDDSNCPITIKSNVDIYDMLNEKHPWLDKYSLEELESSYIKLYKEEYLKSQIAAQLTLNWFFYMKIQSHVNELEMSFITDNSRSGTAPHRFFNLIHLRVFFEKELHKLTHDGSSKDQYTVKFSIPEQDVLEYFTNRYLNLYQYLKDESHPNDLAFKKQFLTKKQFELNYRFFFVTNKKCRVIYLNNEVTRYPQQQLLIFNSDLYEHLNERAIAGSDISARCFYLDKSTQTLYLTLAFNLNELAYTQTVYFTIKHQLTQKTEHTQIEKKKEEAIVNYYDQAIGLTKESAYRVNGSLALDPPSKNVDLDFGVKMTSMDESIEWTLEACWITENQCEDDEVNQMLPHQPIIETQHHVQASEADEYLDQEFTGSEYEHEGNQEEYDPELDNRSGQSKDQTDPDNSKDPLNEFISKPEHDELKYNVTRYSSKVTSTSTNLYDYELEYSLTFTSLNETHNHKILVCSLKPCAHCKCSSSPRFQCDKGSKLVKYLTDKKPVQTKIIKLTRLNFDELNRNSKIIISINSENMLVDLKCLNSSQKDNKPSKVSTTSSDSFKEFFDRHKLPFILLSLLLVSIIIGAVILHIFLKRYFICSKCFLKPKPGSRCHHHHHHVNGEDGRGSSKNSMFRFSSEVGDDLTPANDEEAQVNLLITPRGSHRHNNLNHGDSNGKKKTSEL